MKLLKIVLLIFVIHIILNLKLITNSKWLHYSYWHQNSRQNSHKSITTIGEKPESYKLLIHFRHEGYQIVHRVNKGDYPIYVDVKGLPTYLHLGDITQIVAKYHCDIHNQNRSISGTLTFQLTSVSAGTKTHLELEKEFKNKVIDHLINELQL